MRVMTRHSLRHHPPQGRLTVLTGALVEGLPVPEEALGEGEVDLYAQVDQWLGSILEPFREQRVLPSWAQQ